MQTKPARPKTPRRSACRRPACPPLAAALDARLFKALADPSRLAVLHCLTRSCAPRTVTQVAECCAVDMSVVSRHLAVLRDAGVLAVEKRGREARYSVRYAALCRTLRQLADALEACGCTEPATT